MNVTITRRDTFTTVDYEEWCEACPEAYEQYLKARRETVSTTGEESGCANGPHWDHLLQKVEGPQPVTEEEYRFAAPELRSSLICFVNAKNVLVEGVRFADPNSAQPPQPQDANRVMKLP